MKKENDRYEAVRQSIYVDCPVEDAFRLFTEGFGKWWPLAPYSEAGEDAETCEIEPWRGGRIFERTRSGKEREWGAVTTWNPPGRLEFTWNPGGPRDERQTVAVEFQVEADGTRVTLTHRGWQLAGVAVCVSPSLSGKPGLPGGGALSWASSWWPAAIGGEFPVEDRDTAAVALSWRAAAWSSASRPAWAELFLGRFAAFAAQRLVAA